jgi:tRNA(Ile)-lysidine synthase
MIELSKQIKVFIRKHALTEERLLLGFSGGADSTALLLALQAAGIKEILAVHGHHGLRAAAADADAAWCRTFCEKRGIAFHLEYLDVPGRRLRGESCEAAGRRLRLELWQRLADGAATAVFLGHHGDDVMEELIMRLARGANSSGLSGLREERRFGQVRLLRPLLACRRADIESWLLAQGLSDWRCDRSNSDRIYRRNAVRHEIMPLFRKIFGEDRGLQQAARVLRLDADYLEAAAESALEQVHDRQSWRALHPALLPRVLRLWLERQTKTDIIPSAALIKRLHKALHAQTLRDGRQQLPLAAELAILVSDEGLRLLDRRRATKSGSPAATAAVLWNWRRQPEIRCADGRILQASLLTDTAHDGTRGDAEAKVESFAAAALPEKLLLRTWQHGDRMRPFGAAHRKKLQDIFTDAKVSREKRRHWPLLCAGEEIIWLPGLRRAEFGRVEEGCGARLRIRVLDSQELDK